MSGSVRWIPPFLAGLLALAGIGVAGVGAVSRSSAVEARDGAFRLYVARLEVAKAQERLGESDIEEAEESATRANAIAVRVGDVVERIVKLLDPTVETARDTIASARGGARGATITKRQTEVAARLLGALSGYQTDASHFASLTNGALQRILRALRRTNEDFPPGGAP